MPATAVPAETLIARCNALADPTRFEIVRRLRRGEHCVCELQDLLDASQSRLSFHLKVLRESGLIVDRREGRWVYYALDVDALRGLGEAVEALGVLLPAREAGVCCG